jgi:hypothetical protein
MKVKGIILDEMDLDLIRRNGFTDFVAVSEDEMDEDGTDRYQQWCIEKGEELEAFSPEYMMGQDDAKLFYFSDKQVVIDKIAALFPGCDVVEVDADDYPMDYDYRDRGVSVTP